MITISMQIWPILIEVTFKCLKNSVSSSEKRFIYAFLKEISTK